MTFRIDPRLPLTGEIRRILAEEIGSDGDPEAFLALAEQYRRVPV